MPFTWWVRSSIRRPATSDRPATFHECNQQQSEETMPTNHRAAKAAAAAILALTAGATMATAPASAAPPYLSMTSEIRMTPVGASRTDRGYFNEQVIYIAGVVSMSKAAAQDTINHNENTIALRYWGDDTDDDDILFGPVSPMTL
jgi:hypothetical protein